MKMLTLLCLLLSAVPTFAADLENRVRENRDRIIELELIVQQLRNQLEGSSPAVSPEARLSPVGTWQCDNGVYVYKVIFEEGGQMIQQEPTFGNAKRLRWQMTGPNEIMLSGITRNNDFGSQGNQLEIDFDSQGGMRVRSSASGASWDCRRN